MNPTKQKKIAKIADRGLHRKYSIWSGAASIRRVTPFHWTKYRRCMDSPGGKWESTRLPITAHKELLDFWPPHFYFVRLHWSAKTATRSIPSRCRSALRSDSKDALQSKSRIAIWKARVPRCCNWPGRAPAKK